MYISIDFNGNCLNIGPGRSGVPPDHSQTLLGDFCKIVPAKNIDFLGTTHFAKIDLIWQLWAKCLRQNVRLFMPVLSYFHPTLLKT